MKYMSEYRDPELAKKYLEEINDKENPKDLHSALDGYY